MVVRVWLSVALFFSSLCAFNVDANLSEVDLLPHAELYVDHTQKATIETIGTKPFTPVTQTTLGFGYSPHLHLWIRVTLTNRTSKPIRTILEYANPLTSFVRFYAADSKKLLKQEGLLSKTGESLGINPTLNITLHAHSSQTYYIEAYSHVTTLLAKLRLYTPRAFYKKELRHQFILGLFFGVMGIVILYNFIVFVVTQERIYLYYVLFFVGISVHHLIYKGVAHLYLLPQSLMTHLIEYSIFIVALPAFFLALFMREILALKRYATLNRAFTGYLVLFPFLVVLFSRLGYDNYRNLPAMVLLCLILIVLVIMMFKKNRYAYLIAIGWLLFISSAIAMQLSSMGKYDLFTTYPYYVEFALVLEAILFSLVLSNRIKQLQHETAQAKENLYLQQAQEKQRLKQEVKAKTADLVKMVEEKQLLLKELNHRVKNNLQTILSFVHLQEDAHNDPTLRHAMETLEHRILSVDHLHTLLDPQKGIETVNAQAYFSRIVKHLQESFHMPHIQTTVDAAVTLGFNDALHCGIILNEAVTNAYQHAFGGMKNGNITITLTCKEATCLFRIEDNGKGYDPQSHTDSLGLQLIESLATLYLEGTFHITHTTHGTAIEIAWKERKR